MAIIYLSLVCLLFLFVPKSDIYDDLIPDDRKWYSSSVISEFLGKGLVKLFYMAIIIGIIYLSGRGIAYYTQPAVNKVIRSSGFYSYSDTLMLCDTDLNAYYTIRNIRRAYVPIREDTCIYCGCRYWKHHKIESESERDIRFYIIQGLANDP